MTKSKTRIILYVVAALISLAGLAEATYLTVLNLTGETAVCGGSPDCFRVLGSPYAKIGPLPVAGLGALSYFTAFSCAIFAIFGHRRAHTFLTAVVGVMFAATLWLLYVQAFLLQAFCRYCLFSAALIFLLTGIVVINPPPD